MNIKRGLFAVLAAGTMMLSVAGAAGAAPPPNSNANCTGVEASNVHDIGSFWAHQPNPTGGNGNYVSAAASSDCYIGG